MMIKMELPIEINENNHMAVLSLSNIPHGMIQQSIELALTITFSF